MLVKVAHYLLHSREQTLINHNLHFYYRKNKSKKMQTENLQQRTFQIFDRRDHSPLKQVFNRLDLAQEQERGSNNAHSPNTISEKNVSQKRTKSLLKGNFKKVNTTLEESPENFGTHYVRKMSKQQFRGCMGLLGLESNAFLSDRIFEVVDSDKDQYINFAQFATIMDTLINGEEDEKHEFSFALLDIYETGYLNFEEFREIISKIIAHWCIITGSQVKVDTEGLKGIFDRMDTNKDGIVDLEEYKQALKGNPGLFEWFDLLNQGFNDGKKAKKDMLELKQKAVVDILQLQQKINQVMSQMQSIDLTVQNHAPSSKQSSQLSYFDSNFSGAKRDSLKSHIFQKTIQRDSEEFQLPNDQTVLRKELKVNSFQESKETKTLKNVLFDDSNYARMNSYQNDDIGGISYNLNKFTFNPGTTDINHESEELDDLLVSPVAKKAKKIDYQKEKIMQIKKQQDFHKKMKNEIGEKRMCMEEGINKKGDDDDEVIDDPDSPENNIKKRQRIRDKFMRKQASRTASPFMQLKSMNPYDNNNNEELKSSISNNKNPNNNNLRISFVSANSQMKPENQQSSQVNLNINNLNQKLLSKNQNNGLKQLTQKGQQLYNGNISDFSPAQTHDCARSDFTNAQGGGPPLSKSPNTQKPMSDNSAKQRYFKSKQKSMQITYDDRLSSESLNQNEKALQRQNQILDSLNDIQNLANNLISRLQEDQDSAIGDQIKEYVEQQKAQLIKQMSGKDEEEKKEDDEELDLDNGELRPLKQIQSFFKQRSRKRLIESSKKGTIHIHKPLSQQSKSFIHIGHDNWNLVLHMMLGIRQSVRNVMHEEVFELIEQDFQRKYCYELVAKKTKNMRLFEFYDFSPRVFQLIRTLYGITPDIYLKSIGPENLIGSLLMGNISSLKEQCSTGKSGSFFYYTADSNFMLKTISQNEFHHLRDIFKDYYDHLAMYPHSLITRFFGLHKIKYTKQLGGKARIYFVIMANVFKTSRDLSIRFDLKGSTQGRRTKKSPEDYVDSSVALKDLDFIEEGMKIRVDPDIQKALLQQMEDDVKLFQKLNINDYSLLLGIHYFSDNNEPHDIITTSPNIHQIIKKSFNFSKKLGRSSVSYSTSELRRPPFPFYESHDGGIVSSDGKCMYFIGIIDTLTLFGKKKKFEYRIKSLAYGNKTISCIPPKQYGERFLKFMNNIFEDIPQDTTSIEN